MSIEVVAIDKNGNQIEGCAPQAWHRLDLVRRSGSQGGVVRALTPGSVLLDEMTERAMSYDTLAAQMGVPESVVIGMVLHASEWSAPRIVRLARVLGTSCQMWHRLAVGCGVDPWSVDADTPDEVTS